MSPSYQKTVTPFANKKPSTILHLILKARAKSLSLRSRERIDGMEGSLDLNPFRFKSRRVRHYLGMEPPKPISFWQWNQHVPRSWEDIGARALCQA